MSIKSGQAVTVLFSTANATTGAAADATGTPTGTLYINGTANGATVTVTNITTGIYKAAVTLPSLSAGDIASIRIAATVSSVAGEGVVWQDVADTKRVSDLNDIAAGAAMTLADDAITAGKFDESTAYPLKSADTGSTQVARVGADGDTLETLSDQLDDIPNNAEFEARTLAAASYFDPAADTVANVTAVGSVTGAVGSVTGAVGSVTGNVGGNVTGSVGSVTAGVTLAAGAVTAAAIATNAIDADALAADAVTEIQSGLATQTSVDDIPTNAELATALGTADDATLAAISALNNLSLAQAQSAATAALNAYDPPTKAEMDAGFAAGDDAVLAAIAALNNLSSAGAQAAAAAALTAYGASTVTTAQVNAEVVDVLRTDTLPDSYAADGAQPTIAQATLMIWQYLSERGVSGTTVTVTKPDGVTSAMTFTLDDATEPTSITRSG